MQSKEHCQGQITACDEEIEEDAAGIRAPGGPWRTAAKARPLAQAQKQERESEDRI